MSYYCEDCKREYKSYQSLWNHNKKFHISKLAKNEPKLSQESAENMPNLSNPPISNNKTYKCRHCNKEYIFIQSRYKHEKKCPIKIQKENKHEEDRAFKEKKLEIELKKQEAAVLRLKQRSEQPQKESAITVKKLNRALQLQNNSNNVVNSNNNNTINNTQNNITNNYIVTLGKENIQDFLTDADKKMIIDSKRFALLRLIELVHCGNFNQFRNLFITNLKDNYMYKYDDSQHAFVVVTKEDTLKSLMEYRISDLELIYDQLLLENKIDVKTKRCIERFIDEMKDPEHKEYKYEINDIKMLIFNKSEKIIQDSMENISLIVTVR